MFSLLGVGHNSHPHMTTGKTIVLTRQIFISKVMSLLFNKLSRLVIAFIPRSKHLLVSWLQSPSTVILESKKIKPVTASPSLCYEVMGMEAMILDFWMLRFKPAFFTLLFHPHQEVQFFTSGGQSIGVSASASVLPMNTQDWTPLGWTGWISLQSKDSQQSSPTPQFKSINSSVLSFLYTPTLTPTHDYWKNHSFD